MTTRIHQCVEQAKTLVAGVRDSPQDRYDLRVKFYQRHGYRQALRTLLESESGKSVESVDESGFGKSELAFMRWEIERGVLNPPDAPKPGSAWWRAVNEAILFNGALADLIDSAGVPLDEVPDEPPFGGARLWLEYFGTPTPTSWYRAHNRSVIGGYLDQVDLARLENWEEQKFLNTVLYRLVYADALVEGVDEPFGELGRIIADPRGESVDILVHLPSFYPRDYPMEAEEFQALFQDGHALGPLARTIHNLWGDSALHRAVHALGRPLGLDSTSGKLSGMGRIVAWLFDRFVILSGLGRLYAWSAEVLHLPGLVGLAKNGKPIYPQESDA